MALQTRNVFIDTQSFVKAGLDFQSRAIQAFVEACGKKEMIHIMTTITVHEIEDKIKEAIKEALGRVMDFRRKAKMLEGSSDQAIASLFTPYDPIQVQTEAKQVFEAFIEDSKSTIVDLGKVDANEVFRRYFAHEAPFQEGKKKDEFPDAFSLLAVESHLPEGEQCYVVSEDGDLKAFCEANKRFILTENLGKLLDIYNSHNNERTEFIKRYLTEHQKEIKAEITAQIDSTDFYNNSTWDDAEVISHHVVNVDDYDPDIIEVDDTNCLVSFMANVSYQVQVEGPDFINGVYDREYGRVFVFDKAVRQEDQELEVQTELEITYEVKEGMFKILNCQTHVLGLERGVEIAVEEVEFIDPRM